MTSQSSRSSVALDFATLRSILPHLRVEELKAVLRDINHYNHRACAKISGRKDELIERIEFYLQQAMDYLPPGNYQDIRSSIYRHSKSTYLPFNHSQPSHNPRTPSSASSIAPTAPHRAAAPTYDYGPTPLPGTARPPLRPPAPYPKPTFSAASSLNIVDPDTLPIHFESSPFYRIDSAASGLVVCHKAETSDRKSAALPVVLNQEQRHKLRQNPSCGTTYQLRLFATSETHFNHPVYTPHSPKLPPALTEFPTTADIKLNSQTLTVNLRGIKNQPGTCPPPNLGAIPGSGGVGKALDMADGAVNRVDIAYSNSDKRFFMVVYLVEYYGISSILKNVKANVRRTEERVLAEIRGAADDEDVVASSVAVSLRDPLVLSRIKMPIRSMKCAHLQCFDAQMFYIMMETTPTWLCPVCNMKLKNEDIAIDEYFAGILKAVPSSLGSVTVEADGTWHDEEFKYGNAQKSLKSASSLSRRENTSSSEPALTCSPVGLSRPRPSVVESSGRKRDVTVLELNSDDDDHKEDGGRHDEDGRQYKRCRGVIGDPELLLIDLTQDDD